MDGKFTRADVVALQKYLLTASKLADPQAGDFDGNGKLNVADLLLMKRELHQA